MLLNSSPLIAVGHEVDRIIDFLKPYLNYEDGPWIAGGCLRRIMTLDFADNFDVDVFVKNDDQRLMMHRVKDFYNEKYYPHPKRNTLFTARSAHDGDGATPIQVTFIDRFKTYEDLLEDFDFTACQFVSDGKTIRYSEQSLDDARNKLMRMNNVAKVKDINRIMRYASYGFEAQSCVLESISTHTLSSVSYYKGTAFTAAFKDFIRKVEKYDMRDSITLSLVGDILFERLGDEAVVFVGGAPFPASLALVYMFCTNTRIEIENKLKPLWQQCKVDTKVLNNVVTRMKYEQFIGAYRAFARDDQMSRMTSTIFP